MLLHEVWEEYNRSNRGCWNYCLRDFKNNYSGRVCMDDRLEQQKIPEEAIQALKIVEGVAWQQVGCCRLQCRQA